MNVKQNLSILFYLKRKKTSKDGKAPIYIRITVDGLDDEMSLSCKVLPDHWDNESKQVSDKDPDYVRINKTISQAKTDLERHFDLMQAKNGLVSPTMVKESYLTPVSGQQQRNEKQANLQLSEALDTMIVEYLTYCDKVKKAHAEGRTPGPNKRELLDREKVALKEKMDGLAKKANTLFDKKEHQKTFLLIVNDYLLHFMQLALAGHRSPNTLEKWYGRKKRYQEFLAFRYKLEDIPLADLKYSFIEEVFKFLLVQYEVIENTATKYAQCVKEMMDRAVAKGWIPANIFVIFKCAYDDTDAVWLTWGEMEALIKSRFKKEKLNAIRDIYVFESFTGLSYAEIRRVGPANVITGIDGKKWLSTNRQKTDGDETLPLLPTALELIDKYKEHPICLRRRTLLPVPTNEEYNRCLKEIGRQLGFSIILRTHSARYFFANEIAFRFGVSLKTIGRMLGQKSIKTTEKYVRANRTNISESMETVEAGLFTQDGQLRVRKTASGRDGVLPRGQVMEAGQGARVIQMDRI